MTRILGIVTSLALVLCLVLPDAALAKSKKKGRRSASSASHTKHGIGPGGVPALRDHLQGQIDALQGRVDTLEMTVLLLDTQLQALVASNSDDDLDGFSENQGDCNDMDAAIFPGAVELVGNGLDDDCDGEIDEAPTP